MKIACLQFNPIQENTYVVWDDTKACIVIDAGNSNPREDAALDNFIAEHGLKPVMAVSYTHLDVYKRQRREWSEMPPPGRERRAPYFRSPRIGHPTFESWARIWW